jgi:hypothetical protein
MDALRKHLLVGSCSRGRPGLSESYITLVKAAATMMLRFPAIARFAEVFCIMAPIMCKLGD